MSLRRQNLSPAANLLRNSRLFSLPNPLPRPLVGEPYGAGSLRASDTATLPYPTHQAIATTPSSLARGDWGLKRPLPSRSRLVQTSHPVIRVKQWDTIEHVTDFDSAADHVRTKQKFDEMSIPLVKGMSSFRDHDLTGIAPVSAFEQQADVTAYDSEGLDGAGMYLEALKESAVKNAKVKRAGEKKDSETATFTMPDLPQHKARQANMRWKHEGPWIPGMSADDFTAYLSNKLSHRRTEFNTHLVEYVKVRIYNARSNSAKRDETMPLESLEAEMWLAGKEREWSNISRSDVEAEIRALRAECAADPLNSKLVQELIIPFLRLSPIKVKPVEYAADNASGANQRFSDDTTPSSTHPSAGLGYLRTKSWLTNHPILGPQSLPVPVTARVIQPKKTGTTVESRARLGVAGFVADDEWKSSSMMHNRMTASATDRLDVDTQGGAKLQVQPQYAAISPDGKVNIKLKRSFGAEVRVARGELENMPPQRENVEAKPLENLNFGPSGVPDLDAQAQERTNRDLDNFLGMLRQQQQKKTGEKP